MLEQQLIECKLFNILATKFLLRRTVHATLRVNRLTREINRLSILFSLEHFKKFLEYMLHFAGREGRRPRPSIVTAVVCRRTL